MPTRETRLLSRTLIHKLNKRFVARVTLSNLREEIVEIFESHEFDKRELAIRWLANRVAEQAKSYDLYVMHKIHVVLEQV